ncbi:MAG: DNA internalization-related competence protein ComEC/Rec2 [Deltaproteobacteria bacterium]|nr:DNA internalization-related competence protein ComEC/Rec2 [Deltaproteobacteria bacterium]
MNFSIKNLPFWVPTFIAKRSDEALYRPLICLVAALIPGVLAGTTFPGHLWTAFLLAFTNIILVGICVKRGKPAVILPLVLFFILGYLSIQPWVWPRFSDNHLTRYTDGKVYRLTGIIDEIPRVSDRRTRFILRAQALDVNGSLRPATGRIRISVTGNPGLLQKGDEIVLDTKIRPVHNFNNPGGFDYQRYMSFKKIWVTGYARAGKIEIPKPDPPHRNATLLQRLRRSISDKIDGLPFAETDTSTPVKRVMKALLIGDRNALTPQIREIFNRSGTSHLLAISGLHVGIVAGAAFFIFRWALSSFKPLLWLGRTRTAAAILSFFPVMVYGLMAGMSPSTQRAVIMVTVFLMTYLSGRDQDMINTLAVAALVIVAIHPPTLFSISFQLSFTAVFAIVLGISKLVPAREKNRRWWQSMAARTGMLFMVSVCATIGTLPIVMYYFNQVSLVGVVVNVIAVPLVGFIVVPVGLVSVLIAMLYPPAAAIGFLVCAHVLALAIHIISFFAALPFAAVKTVTPGILEMVCYYIILWGAVTLVSGAKRNLQDGFVRKWLPAAVLAAVVMLGADVLYWVNERYLAKDLRVTILDVGQGSAALLELPKGYNILVDGGGFSDNTTFDVGARIVAPYLWKRKIKTIHSIVLSHPNSDHLNGLTYIVEHFNVKNAWTNNETSRSKGYRIFAETLKRNAVFCPRYEDLARTRSINGVELVFLYPEKGFLERRSAEPWRNANNNSLILQASYGDHDFLFPGDIMADGEAALLKLNPGVLESLVLIAPHHGSQSSSTAKFVQRVDPGIVVISAGWKNRFRFPHEKVLGRYARQGSRIYRTDLDGAVRMDSDGETLRVRPTIERGPGAG